MPFKSQEEKSAHFKHQKQPGRDEGSSEEVMGIKLEKETSSYIVRKTSSLGLGCSPVAEGKLKVAKPGVLPSQSLK